jgi:hypothetical protein
VEPGEQRDFESFSRCLRAQAQPVGEREEASFRLLVRAAWNMRRMRILEAGLAIDGQNSLFDDDLAPILTRYQRYHARFENSYYRASRALRKLQSERAAVAAKRPARVGFLTTAGLKPVAG